MTITLHPAPASVHLYEVADEARAYASRVDAPATRRAYAADGRAFDHYIRKGRCFEIMQRRS